MEYRLGNSDKIKSRGTTAEIECPHCKNRVKFSVFSNMDTRLIPSYPLINSESVYFFVCPKCAFVYSVDEQQGDALRSGEKYAIGDFDLKELKVFKK